MCARRDMYLALGARVGPLCGARCVGVGVGVAVHSVGSGQAARGQRRKNSFIHSRQFAI